MRGEQPNESGTKVTTLPEVRKVIDSFAMTNFLSRDCQKVRKAQLI